MAYYERSESYFDYDYDDYQSDSRRNDDYLSDSRRNDDYLSDSRRNSNSLSEETSAAKRRKSNWGGGGRGGRQFSRGGGNRKAPSRNVTIDTPLFQEPKRAPLPPRRSPQIPIQTPRRSPQIPADARKRGRERSNSFRSNARPTPPHAFDMRSMPNFVEPQHQGPAWNWDNYAQGCKNWQNKHKLAYYQSRCVALEFENQMLFEQINQLIKENIVLADERGVPPTMVVPDIPGSGTAPQKAAASTSKTQGKSSLPADDVAGSGLEFNLTEDAVNFLETNIRHKLTLKKEKLKKNAKATEGDGPKRTGLKRKEELEQLYGKDSAMIQGLETSLQLNFNRVCDTFKPELYPAAPLNPDNVVG